jgi:hypothetical protein
MKKNKPIYEPFGEEWEAELMKLPKKFIIELYRKVCKQLHDQGRFQLEQITKQDETD